MCSVALIYLIYIKAFAFKEINILHKKKNVCSKINLSEFIGELFKTELKKNHKSKNHEIS